MLSLKIDCDILHNKKGVLMNEFSTLFQIGMLIVAYFAITLLIIIIRSVIDYRSYSWIGGDCYFKYLWPRLKFWLIGIFCTIIIIAVARVTENNTLEILINNTISNIGIFFFIPLIIGTYIAVCVIIGIMLPVAASIQELYEIDLW